ncbi:MAG: YdjY domain-containing protein [Acidobacteriota bacterium]
MHPDDSPAAAPGPSAPLPLAAGGWFPALSTVLPLLLPAAIMSCCSRQPPQVELLPDGTVRFSAVVQAHGFEKGPMPGYHAIVYRGGKAAPSALFLAEVTDLQVLDALESLGGEPGNNLDRDTWEQRDNPASPAPDRVITGDAVEIRVALPGRREPLPLDALLSDTAGRGVDMRLGGNRPSIDWWKSGCIACLYSCPGSKVGNARTTVRDFVRGTTRFRLRPGLLPPDGSRVGILLKLRPQAIPSPDS